MKKSALKVPRSKAITPRSKRKLDALTGAFVHARDKGKLCIDGCGRKGEQSGHFRRREYMNTRWNLKNQNLQSAYCNCWLSGNEFEYGIGIDKKWGAGTAKKLHALSKEYKSWSEAEAKELIAAAKNGIESYEKKYEELTKEEIGKTP